jgi:hypothetical protein
LLIIVVIAIVVMFSKSVVKVVVAGFAVQSSVVL